MSVEDTIASLDVSAHTVPTEVPEADGTFAWESVTLVLCQLRARSGTRGLGFTYCSAAAASVVDGLQDLVVGMAVDAPGKVWDRLLRQVRNAGRPGVAACAISAIDIALWDLRARAHDEPLSALLGVHRDSVPVYGSGGLTSYSDRQLIEQFEGWVAEGIPRVKMKIGTDWGSRTDLDLYRVKVARDAIGDATELYVDANGAYGAGAAIRLAHRLSQELGVTYFEEPVSSDQVEELAENQGHRLPGEGLIRLRAPRWGPCAR